MQPIMGLLPLTQKVGTSARLDRMQTWVKAVEDVGYISQTYFIILTPPSPH